MKNRICTLLIFMGSFLFALSQSAFAQEHDTLFSYPNLTIPVEGEPGIADTIEIDFNVTIQDINFYVGVNTYFYIPGELIMTITSPWGTDVTLHNHNNEPQFPCWIDTDAEEDGPGNLDDYLGYNARGQWIMYVVRYADHSSLVWDSWGIEVIGEPVVGLSDENRPLITGLDTNYPNPFNSYTVIHFTVAQTADVSFAIYDVMGRLVRDFELTNYEPGHHQLKWDGLNAAGENVSSGLYFLKMTVGSTDSRQIFRRKLTLLK